MNAQEARDLWKSSNTAENYQYIGVKQQIEANVKKGRLDFPEELGAETVAILIQEGYKVLPVVREQDGKMYTPVIWAE